MRTLLVANRGEIAVRIIRTAREMGLRTVAVASEADVGSAHVAAADGHVVIGPAQAAKSYLDVDAVVAAVRSSGADAVHPGYGFLSERASFAQRLEEEGITFVGPSAHAISTMGDKALARATAAAAGVPTVPGSDGAVSGVEAAVADAERIGYPVALKAAAGGGGRGIRVVADQGGLRSALPVVQAEAGSAFGDPTVYLEAFIPAAKHVEVQVLGDGEKTIHLGDRDCSMQRRRQKVVEEAPADLPGAVRERLHAAAVALAEQVSYRGAGTVEFLYDHRDDSVYFIEMNTRLQVEHPVTEMVTGVDLVREQLRVAAGQPLTLTQDDVVVRGHAIELRLTAEDPEQNFFPSPGTITALSMPGGPFVRVDSGVRAGDEVSPFYDPLIAKVVVWDATRELAIAKSRRALEEVEVEGITTTAPFLGRLLASDLFAGGEHHTTSLEQWMEQA